MGEQTSEVRRPPDGAGRWRSARLALVWMALALVCAAADLMRVNFVIKIALAAACAYALYAAVIHLLGVSLRPTGLRAPRPIANWLLAFPISRTRIPLAGLASLTAYGEHMGHEVVGCGTPNGEMRILLGNRDERLRLFEAVRSLNENVKIYRAF